MTKLPEISTVQKIYKLYEDRESSRTRRSYLGGSLIGEDCERKLWYFLRWVKKAVMEGRIYRLFETGNIEEDRLIKNLRDVGVKVLDRDANNKQWSVSKFNNYLSGHFDGVLIGLPEAPKTWHLLEIKTMKESKFNLLKKHGVKKQFPTYFAQLQVYMGLSDLTRAAFFAVNKNTDEIYLERIKIEKKYYNGLIKRAQRIIFDNTIPSRITEDPTNYQCTFCDFKKVCHKIEFPDVNCRTCARFSFDVNGGCVPFCGRLNKELTFTEQESACDSHIFEPRILDDSVVLIGGDSESIEYSVRETGECFLNATKIGFPGKDLPHYTSKELSRVLLSDVGDPVLEAARIELDGEIIT